MRTFHLAAIAGVIATSACAAPFSSPPLGTTDTTPQHTLFAARPANAKARLWPRPGPSRRVCGPVMPGFARCNALVRTDVKGRPAVIAYGPADLQTAYSLTPYSAANGGGTTVAIVDAFDNPNAASDLAVYRNYYGLPPCSPSSGCFTKVQFGKRINKGWVEEESLDVDMVSAICPNCNILLVEAATNSIRNLEAAEKYATAHASYVSNSWGAPEIYNGQQNFPNGLPQVFDVPGVAITASTGDSSYNDPALYPAIFPTVIGVGGTSLGSVNPRAETAWSGAGSGCSQIFAQPNFQQGLSTGCTNRAEADAAADADPYSGVAVYDSYKNKFGWWIFGGTSVASPIVASVFALAGNTATNNPAYLYANAANLNDITSGANGNCGAPLCVAGAGWDGPTGLGTPNGIAAF
jgi:subtilase family serine protease